MKESILDVLLYLFTHYLTADASQPLGVSASPTAIPLFSQLPQAGFSPAEIHKAFDWLDALAEQRPAAGSARSDGPTRVYFGPELDKLDTECRGFLLFLELRGILSAEQ